MKAATNGNASPMQQVVGKYCACSIYLSIDQSILARSLNLQKWRQRQFLAVLLKQSKHFKQILRHLFEPVRKLRRA